MGILKEAAADRVRSRVYGKLRNRRVPATAGPANAPTGNPEPAHA